MVREGNRLIKEKFEKLLCGECIWSEIDEQIVYNQLDGNEKAVWSLLLAGGYLKVLSYEKYQDIPEGTEPKYQLALTNLEVKLMFQRMIHDWFAPVQPDYNDFVKAMVAGDVDAMNEYMNRIALQTFSYFDTGDRASGAEPERFYHGFVLGLLIDLRDRYYLEVNRESGFGRYDIMLEPKHLTLTAHLSMPRAVFESAPSKFPQQSSWNNYLHMHLQRRLPRDFPNFMPAMIAIPRESNSSSTRVFFWCSSGVFRSSTRSRNRPARIGSAKIVIAVI